MPDRLATLIARQDHVITLSQATAAGLSIEGWRWRLASGRWRRVIPGVAVAHSGDITFGQYTRAALLSAGDRVLLSGDVALVHAGLVLGDLKRIDLAVPHERRVDPLRLRAGPEVVLHRCRQLGALATFRAELPRLAAHAAVLHAAAWAKTGRTAEHRIAAVIQKGLTAVPLIREQLALLPQLPRRGLVRAVLDDVELGAHAGSELAYLRFCRTHGLPLPDSLQLAVRHDSGRHYLDARYDRQKVTLELDGAHHREVGHWEADTLRTLRVVATLPGEQVLRLTMGNLRHDGDEVASLLRVILA